MTVSNNQIAQEVTRLHDYFTRWFAGANARDDSQFNQEITAHLSPDFFNIQPSGKLLSRDILLAQIREGYGSNPDFRIKVGKVQIHQFLPDKIVLATYEEYQQGAKNSPPKNARLSSALLQQHEDGFQWLSVHETWLPSEQVTASMFEF